MAILTYSSLIKLVNNGVIRADLKNINGSSIDITLDNIILVERKPKRADFTPVIRLTDKCAQMQFDEYDLNANGGEFILQPGQFVLASSREVFNLPCDISAEYKLKSSQARNALNHLNAGWCDPWWSNSKLTLEFKNDSQYHATALTYGMKCGQMVFHKSKPVPKQHGYSKKGQYNDQKTTTAAGSLK